MVIQRGEIWWADIPEPAESAPGYRRPVLVLQSDDFTRSRIQTVIVIVLTTNLRLAEAPVNVLIMAGDAGLPKDSVVNVSQIITVNKSFLTERVRRVDAQIMFLVEDGVRTVLGL